jgi:hypothetical protein
MIGRDGQFEFVGLPSGKYEIFTSVRDYRLHGNRTPSKLPSTGTSMISQSPSTVGAPTVGKARH